MLIMTTKINRWKVIALGVAVLGAVSSLFFLKEDTLPTFAQQGKMSSGEARMEFIESLGWQVEESDVMEINIPREFDRVYEQYNDLQKTQGFDLAKYRGKRAMNYCYTVKNHPSGEQGVKLSLVVYKDKIIAGDVSSPRLEGFMHGLEMPKENKKDA